MRKNLMIPIAAVMGILILAIVMGVAMKSEDAPAPVPLVADPQVQAPPSPSAEPRPQPKDLKEARVYLSLLEKLQTERSSVSFAEVYSAAGALVDQLRTGDAERAGGEETLPGILLGSNNSEWVDRTELDLTFFGDLAQEKGDKEDRLFIAYLEKIKKIQWQKDSKTIAYETFYVPCLNTGKNGMAAFYNEISTTGDLLKNTTYSFKEDLERLLAAIDAPDLCFCGSKAAVTKDLGEFDSQVSDKKVKEKIKTMLTGLDSFIYNGECVAK